MTENQKKILGLVSVQIIDMTETEEKIKEYVDIFSLMNPVSEGEKEEVIKELHSKLKIRMDQGSSVRNKDHRPWYYAQKKALDSVFWDRYVQYLLYDEGFGKNVINSLDRSTDEMMDLLGNPASAKGYMQRGLVIGDVQSGKTSTYLALLNKAADAGYKIIILLTGTIEKLRRQTQKRMDYGFVGLDSTAFNNNKEKVEVGVGRFELNQKGEVWAVTSTSGDFNFSRATQTNLKVRSNSVPSLFVLKKIKVYLRI